MKRQKIATEHRRRSGWILALKITLIVLASLAALFGITILSSGFGGAIPLFSVTVKGETYYGGGGDLGNVDSGTVGTVNRPFGGEYAIKIFSAKTSGTITVGGEEIKWDNVSEKDMTSAFKVTAEGDRFSIDYESPSAVYAEIIGAGAEIKTLTGNPFSLSVTCRSREYRFGFTVGNILPTDPSGGDPNEGGDNQDDPTPHTHIYASSVIAPTCTESGYTLFQCLCGNKYTDHFKPALGHKFEGDTCTRCGLEREHVHDYSVTIVAPTCTERGYTNHKCDCGQAYIDDYVDPIGHKWNAGTVTAPTCTAEGYTTYICSVCDATQEGATVPALGHDYPAESDACTRCGLERDHTHSFEDIVISPSCTERGYTIHTCWCGETYRDRYIDAVGHKWNAGELTAPTCTADGYTTYTCTVCGITEERDTVAALGHEYPAESDACSRCGLERDHTHSYSKSVIAPTCTERGYTIHTCWCGDTYRDNYKDASGHKWDSGTVIEPTCTTDGYTTYTCTVCTATQERNPVKALGHDYPPESDACTRCGLERDHVHEYKDTVIEPTCTERGYTIHTCWCGETYRDRYIAAKGHAWDKGTVTAPTCTEEGFTTYTCTVCGITEERDPVAALGHNFVENSDACTRCGYKREHTHKYEDSVVEPTCTEKGVTTYTCWCGDSYQEFKEALGHAWDDGTVIEPTCTTGGHTTYLCSRCGEAENREHTNPLGHLETEKETHAATCTLRGYTLYECSRCGAVRKGDYVTALGHIYLDGVCSRCGEAHPHEYSEKVVEPTCTERGYTTYTCTCGYWYNGNYVDAVGHKWDEGELTAPTCTTEGFTTYTCTVCNVTEKRDKTNALGHTTVEETVAATCIEGGYTKHVCTVCGKVVNCSNFTDPLGHSYPAESDTCSRCGIERAHTHTWSDEKIVPANCTDGGYTEITCWCGMSNKYNFTDALGHAWVDGICSRCGLEHAHSYKDIVSKVEATCTERGYTTFSCSCGHFMVGDIVDPLGHEYFAESVTPATCTEQGYTTFLCSRCHKDSYKDNYTNPTGHSLVTTVHPATCTEQGYTHSVCSVCKYEKTSDYVPIIAHSYPANSDTCSVCGHVRNHNFQKLSETAATCTTGGYTTYKCSGCGVTEKRDQTNALGHAYETERVEPTCTTDGHTQSVCSRCGNSKDYARLPATGHTEQVANTVAPTCTASGYTTYKCSKCGTTRNGNHVNALGHNYVASSSSDKERCSRCGAERPHTHSYTTEIVAPTCSAKGYTIYKCSTCGYRYTDNYTNTVSHTWGSDGYCTVCKTHNHRYSTVVHEKTCTEAGYTVYSCSCGKTYQDNYIPAPGHKLPNGVTGGVCERCGKTIHVCTGGDRCDPGKNGFETCKAGSGCCEGAKCCVGCKFCAPAEEISERGEFFGGNQSADDYKIGFLYEAPAVKEKFQTECTNEDDGSNTATFTIRATESDFLIVFYLEIFVGGSHVIDASDYRIHTLDEIEASDGINAEGTFVLDSGFWNDPNSYIVINVYARFAKPLDSMVTLVPVIGDTAIDATKVDYSLSFTPNNQVSFRVNTSFNYMIESVSIDGIGMEYNGVSPYGGEYLFDFPSSSDIQIEIFLVTKAQFEHGDVNFCRYGVHLFESGSCIHCGKYEDESSIIDDYVKVQNPIGYDYQIVYHETSGFGEITIFYSSEQYLELETVTVTYEETGDEMVLKTKNKRFGSVTFAYDMNEPITITL